MQQDVRSPGEDQATDVRVLHARQEMLLNAFAEVKGVLKSVEETVAIFKVFDLQIRQQGLDQERLERIFGELSKRVSDMEHSLEKRISEVHDDLSEEVDKVSVATDTIQNRVANKLAWVQGAVAAVTFLGAIMYGFGVWWGGRYVETIEDNDRYIHTMKTLQAEEHLRDSLGDKGKKVVLDEDPVVTRKGRRL